MNPENLNRTQFEFVHRTPDPTSPLDVRALYHSVHGIGAAQGSVMYWHKKSGIIGNVEVPEQSRRKGIATAMLGEARRIASETRGVPKPRHSPMRTDLGEKWARSLGERLPRQHKLETEFG